MSLACPWAHRTLIFRKLKKLEDAISISVTSWHMGRDGWTFDEAQGSSGDALFGKARLADIYLAADGHYSGRASVPVLWDKVRKTIVNNESADIIRMLNSAFDAFTDARADFYPRLLRAPRVRIGTSNPKATLES